MSALRDYRWLTIGAGVMMLVAIAIALAGIFIRDVDTNTSVSLAVAYVALGISLALQVSAFVKSDNERRSADNKLADRFSDLTGLVEKLLEGPTSQSSISSAAHDDGLKVDIKKVRRSWLVTAQSGKSKTEVSWK